MKTYSNDQISVSFDQNVCIHSENCISELPNVFDVNKRPWINVEGSPVDEIVKTVQNCPSGALSYHLSENTVVQEVPSAFQIHVTKKGPYVIQGGVIVIDDNGTPLYKEGTCALCRCGASKNKPFCDGSHKNVDF